MSAEIIAERGISGLLLLPIGTAAENARPLGRGDRLETFVVIDERPSAFRTNGRLLKINLSNPGDLSAGKAAEITEGLALTPDTVGRDRIGKAGMTEEIGESGRRTGDVPIVMDDLDGPTGPAGELRDLALGDETVTETMEMRPRPPKIGRGGTAGIVTVAVLPPRMEDDRTRIDMEPLQDFEGGLPKKVGTFLGPHETEGGILRRGDDDMDKTAFRRQLKLLKDHDTFVDLAGLANACIPSTGGTGKTPTMNGCGHNEIGRLAAGDVKLFPLPGIVNRVKIPAICPVTTSKGDGPYQGGKVLGDLAETHPETMQKLLNGEVITIGRIIGI